MKTWFGCSAHLIQLCVGDAMKEGYKYQRFANAIAKCKQIAKLDKNSTIFAQLLKKRVMQCTVVRWNSTLSLIGSILGQQNTIESALREGEKDNLLLDAEEVEILKDFRTIASFFKEATDNFQNDSAGIDKIPICQLLENALRSLNFEQSAASNAIKEASLSSLFQRFAFVKFSPMCIFATTADPQTKLSIVGTKNLNFLYSEEGCLKIAKDFTAKNEGLSVISVTEPVNKHAKMSLFDFAESQPQTSADETPRTEFLSFLYAPKAAVSAISYWSARPETPLLELVSAVTSAFPSSASIERMFSTAGDIQRPKRATISPDNLSKLLFLKYNFE